MMVSNAHENLTAEQRAEIDEIASLLTEIDPSRWGE